MDPVRGWRRARLRGGILIRNGSRLECPLQEEQILPDSAFTVAVWLKPARLDRNQAIVARAREGGGEQFYFGLRRNLLHLASPAWKYVSGPLPVGPDEWVHVAFTRAADGTVTLYAAGLPVGSRRSAQSAPVRALGPLLVGTGVDRPERLRPGHFEQQYIGFMDDLVVVGRVLSDEEIARLASGGGS